MAEATGTRFSCSACGKSYRWKPEIAGRKVKCTCGHVMIAPKDMAAQPAPDELIPLADEPQAAHSVMGDQIMAATAIGAPAVRSMAPSPKPKGTSKTGRCPACNKSLPADAVVCVACGLNLKTGKKMETTAAATPPARTVRVNAGQVLGKHRPQPPAEKSRKTLYVLTGVLVAAAAAAASFYFLR